MRRDPVLEVLDELKRSRSARLVRRFRHGSGGTSLVALDGELVVLKAWPASSPTAAGLDGALARMRVMRSRGVPIPQVVERGELAGCSYLVYERLPGRWPARVSSRLLEETGRGRQRRARSRGRRGR